MTVDVACLTFLSKYETEIKKNLVKVVKVQKNEHFIASSNFDMQNWVSTLLALVPGWEPSLPISN